MYMQELCDSISPTCSLLMQNSIKLNEQVLSCWVVMIIPIPLPQHRLSAPAHFLSETTFRPDEDQGNPGRNVVSDKKCAGAEGEELVLV